MATLGELFAKLGAGERLSLQEIDQLRLRGNNLEAASTHQWAEVGGTEPSFQSFYAAEAEFGVAPLESGRISSAGSGAVSVPDSTWTVLLDVGEKTEDFGIKCDVDTGIFNLREKSTPEGAKFLYWWHVNWGANTTGDRLLSLFDTGDTELVRWGKVANTAPSGDIVHNNTYWWGISGFSGDEHYFKVWQNSTVTINVDWFRIGVIRIH